MASHAVSEQAISDLARRNPALAESLTHTNLRDIEVRAARSGAVTLADRGILLGSAYDPVAEATRQAEAESPEEADLLVAVGVGLGHHIEAFQGAARCPVLVYEPSAARLRALLDCGALSGLIARDDVHWAHDLDDLARRFGALYTAGSRVRTWVHPAVARLDPEPVRTSLERLKRAKDASDLTAVTRVKMSAAWAELTVANSAELVATPSFARLAGAFPGVPAVVAAAGPSLERQLPRLAGIADRVLVIAIGQSLRALRGAGIEPDLVHVIESQDVAHQIECAGSPERENLVLGPSVNPSLFRLPVRSRFVATPVTNPLAQWLAGSWGEDEWFGGGSTVALGAVRLAAALGADPILLVGQDLAFTEGRCYATGTAYDMLSLRRDEDGRLLYTNVRGKATLFGNADAHAPERPVDVVMVDGWDGEPVATSKSYASFIDQYSAMGRHLSERGVRLVNCTEGGARIPGLEHRAFADETRDLPAAPHDARERIGRLHDTAPERDEAAPLRAIQEAHRTLANIDAELRRARRLAKRADAARGPVRDLAPLRALARSQRRLHRMTGELPWLDGLIAAELQRVAVETSKERADDDDLATALAKISRLVETTGAGVRAGRELLERLTARLDAASKGHGRSSGAAHAHLADGRATRP
ncbi:MAG: motility associated factor glycosyltransferase family protein [Myxococcota bacterium]